MKTSLWIYAAAGYNVALALFHLMFWRIFQWRAELPKLHPVNRGAMQVMNIMLTFGFLGFAALLVLFREAMVTTGLGRALLAAAMFFWIVRAIVQPIFFRGVQRTTNIGFVMVCLAGAGLHALAFPIN